MMLFRPRRAEARQHTRDLEMRGQRKPALRSVIRDSRLTQVLAAGGDQAGYAVEGEAMVFGIKLALTLAALATGLWAAWLWHKSSRVPLPVAITGMAIRSGFGEP